MVEDVRGNSATIPPVSLDTRYLAAWNEMNTRITQRQNLITIYLTLAFAVLGAATAELHTPFALWRIAYLVPIATLMFTSLLYMHEKMLHNLQVFMARCEAVGEQPSVPNYHKWSTFTTYAAHARILHDYVCGGLIVGFNALATAVVALKQTPPVTPYDPPVQVALVGLVVAALVQVKRISAFRHKPDQGLDPTSPALERSDPIT